MLASGSSRMRIFGRGAGPRRRAALLLPTGEIADRTLGDIGQAHALEQAIGVSEIVFGMTSEQARLADESHPHDLPHRYGKSPFDILPLRHVTEQVSSATGSARAEAQHAHAAAIAFQQPEHDFEQGRLARPVGPDDSQAAPLLDVQSDVAEGEPGDAIGSRFIATGVVRETNVIDADRVGAIAMLGQAAVGMNVAMGVVHRGSPRAEPP